MICRPATVFATVEDDGGAVVSLVLTRPAAAFALSTPEGVSSLVNDLETGAAWALRPRRYLGRTDFVGFRVPIPVSALDEFGIDGVFAPDVDVEFESVR